MIMYGAKARTYAATGEVGLCRKQVQAAEAAFGLADPGAPGWVGRLADPARLGALSGHALADLATRTGDAADRGDAAERLEQAIDGFDPQVHARARALCVARLGLLHATSDDPDRSGHWAASIREQLPPGPQIQSGRLGVAIQSVQTDQETDEPGPLGSTDAEKG